MDTSNILFVCGGTFVGLESIIRKRIGGSIGFHSTRGQDGVDLEDVGAVLRRVSPEDLVEYGMIPELIGRLPVAATLDPLDVDAMVRILTEPKDALVRQYQKFFEFEACELEFTNDALRRIAERALERKTGARALRAVAEEIMLDAMYELPERNKSGRWVVTDEVVDGKVKLFDTRPRRRRESA
jgi:ATP-dependent Clp protease ATP-binding subunit ClpX